MKLGYYSTSDPDIIVHRNTISLLQYFETLNMYYNHTYKNDLNCTIKSEIVSDLANH